MMTQSYGLDRHLDSAAAPPIAAVLQDMRGQALRIDGSSVGFAGALCLQVLIAARLQWDADDCAFQVAPLSSAFANALRGLGIELPAIGASPNNIIDEECAQ